VPVACIGNPYDWDLECEEGSTPRRSGYAPFHTSAGEITDVRVEIDLESALGGYGHGPTLDPCFFFLLFFFHTTSLISIVNSLHPVTPLT
jgi:hypothetical protein